MTDLTEPILTVQDILLTARNAMRARFELEKDERLRRFYRDKAMALEEMILEHKYIRHYRATENGNPEARNS